MKEYDKKFEKLDADEVPETGSKKVPQSKKVQIKRLIANNPEFREIYEVLEKYRQAAVEEIQGVHQDRVFSKNILERISKKNCVLRRNFCLA